MHELRCCCGRNDCAFLAHNHSIIEDLERDVHEAGRAGQMLLERHEQHIRDSLQERDKLMSAMEALEKNKEALEASNARIIEENRDLLDQLEEMNNACADSDIHISSLKTTLESTQNELQRLNSLAHKAAQLEMELILLEAERAKLDTDLAMNEHEKKAAVQRWRKAESTIGNLQDQIDTMEKENREEKERHEEVLSRVERQRTVNLHLSTNDTVARASGVTHSTEDDGSGRGVVTHFVKDILQDNSNLQIGILELKELLLASNAEVTNLRSQLELNQPLSDANAGTPSLDSELKSFEASETSLETVPELHVHHHYHQQRQLPRKPRKRRPVLPTGHLLRFPTSMAQGHEGTASRGYSYAAATILSNTSVSIPAGHRPRWSMQSTATESSYAPSSLATSPRHPSSVFDNYDMAFDSTRPTTPSSSVPGSPLLLSTVGTPDCNSDIDDPSPFSPFPAGHFRQPSYLGDMIIPEEQESTADATTEDISSAAITPKASRRELRRVMSHESLLSISGMDIHAPSRSFSSGSYGKSPISLIAAGSLTNAYSSPTVTSTMAAPSSLARSATNSSDLARLLLSQQSSHNVQHADDSKPLGKRMGSWVFGKWGAAPTTSASVDDLHARASMSGSAGPAPDPSENPMAAIFRSPGINQSGPILGFPKPRRAPSNVQPVTINTDLLKESLETQ